MSRFGTLKRVLLGRPLATAEEHHERLSKKFALPVFSADAISSTAYATEEILLALIAAGIGGAGLVAADRLGGRGAAGHRGPLVPADGARLSQRGRLVRREPGQPGAGAGTGRRGLVDGGLHGHRGGERVLGVAAITSAFPSLCTSIGCSSASGLVVLIALANLRGVRESGRIFAAPTYLFVLLCGGLVVVGFIRWLMGDLHAVQAQSVGGGPGADRCSWSCGRSPEAAPP